MSVFISYRRTEQDVGIAAWGLSQKLRQNGWDVFMDLEIPPLADWKAVLHTAVTNSSLMLVAIGPMWLELLQEHRESNDADWVRFEVSTALTREIPIGAVLFGDAKMPTAQDLPEDIRKLTDRQTVRLDTSSPNDFDRDCSSFSADLDRHYRQKPVYTIASTTDLSGVDKILRPPPTVILENTIWVWPGNRQVTFKPEGKVIFSDIEAIGYWELKGNHLQFDCNRFTMFDVVVTDDSMKGEWYRIGNTSDRSMTALKRVS